MYRSSSSVPWRYALSKRPDRYEGSGRRRPRIAVDLITGANISQKSMFSRYKDHCLRRHLAAVDRVELLVLEGGELVVLAELPALGVHVTHCFAVIARVRCQQQKMLVGGSKVVTSGRVESLNFGKRGPEEVIETIKLIVRFVVWESRLGQGRQRCTGAVGDRQRRRCHDHLAGLSTLYGRTWHNRRCTCRRLRRLVISGGRVLA